MFTFDSFHLPASMVRVTRVGSITVGTVITSIVRHSTVWPPHVSEPCINNRCELSDTSVFLEALAIEKEENNPPLFYGYQF